MCVDTKTEFDRWIMNIRIAKVYRIDFYREIPSFYF